MEKRIMNSLIINGISVNSIDTTSGIFVGINNVNNWSSNRKHNYGFGSVSHSNVSENYCIVIDNDLIDTPIEHYAVTYMDGEQDINNLDVKEINVNSMDSNTAVSVGENILNEWSAHGKRNQGTGRSAGISQVKSNVNVIVDNDLIDSTINEKLFSSF